MTHSMTRCHPVGVRAEGLHPLQFLLSWGPQTGPAFMLPASGPVRLHVKGPRRRWIRSDGSLAYPTAAVDETTMLSSGRDLTPGPLICPESVSSLRDWGPRLLCPSSHFRRSHLVVLGFLPAISAQPGCNLAPEAPMGPILETPGLWSLGVRGTNCLLSLPWSSLLSEWCCLPSPRLWGLFVCLHLCFYIYTYI